MSDVQTDLRRLYKHPVGRSKNNKEIYAYLTQPPLSITIARNPHLMSLVKEIVTNNELQPESEYVEYDMGRTIGYAERVKTEPGDVIFYAKMHKTGNYTRFVKNHRAKATTFLTFKVQCDEAGNYEVVNVWLGKKYPAVPGSDNASSGSRPYWEDHAVVYNGQQIIASTITKLCPY